MKIYFEGDIGVYFSSYSLQAGVRISALNSELCRSIKYYLRSAFAAF